MTQGASGFQTTDSTTPQAPILVIEDDMDIRETCRQVLECEGYSVVTAANGAQGIEILRTPVYPALILLDLMMPVMNGWEFLKARSGDPALQAIPVVVVTAAGLAAGEQPASVQGFLRKPLELEDLLEAVKSAARLR